MKYLLRSIGLATALSAVAAAAQPEHTQHQAGSPSRDGTLEERIERIVPALPGSAFVGYRAFTPDEPLKDWRTANEEVRATGGHTGMMKGGDEAPASHEGHHSGEGKKP